MATATGQPLTADQLKNMKAAPTVNPVTGLPYSAVQQKNINTQYQQLTGQMTPAQAQAQRDKATADALASSKTINRFQPTTPEQVKAQADINVKYGLSPDTGMNKLPAAQVNQAYNTALQAPRANPTVATTTNPVVSKGTQPLPPAAGPVSDNQMMENIAFKKVKGEPLTDDEVRFQIKQSIGKYQAPASPATNFSTTTSSSQKGGGYYRANVSGNPNKVALPSMYRTEEEFAAKDPAGYDKWADQNGYSYSFDDNQYHDRLPFSIDEYINATPEAQLAMQNALYSDYGKGLQQMINAGYDAQGQAIDNRGQRLKDRIAEEEASITADNEEKLKAFKEEQGALSNEAIGRVQQAGNARLGELKDMQSFSGFGRSTKTMELISNASADTQNQIADIERQSNHAVTEYQVSLLDKMDQKLQGLRDKLDANADEKDNLEIERVKGNIQLATDLFKQSPMNPQNMVQTAEKIQTQRMEQAKMDAEEKRAVQKAASDNFQWMVNTFGSNYVQNLDDASIENLAYNMGVSPEAIKSIGPTMKEVEQQWDQLKYAADQEYKMMNFQYQVQNDQANRQWQATMADQGFARDLQKLGINFDMDVKKMYLGQQFKDAEDMKKYQNLSYGTFGSAATGANGSSMFFQQPVNHPATGAPVVAMNPKIANAYPPGYKKSPGESGYGGQCAYEARQIANCEPLGNTLASKTAKLDQYISEGKGFRKGMGQPQPGDVLISSLSKTTGHAAVVNAITADGNIVLSEFNYPKPLAFSNSRTISPTSGEVVGFIRAGLKPQYQVSVDDAKKIAGKVTDTISKQIPDGATGTLIKLFGQVAATTPMGQKLGNLGTAVLGGIAQKGINDMEQQGIDQNIMQQGMGDVDFQQRYDNGEIDENGFQITPDRSAVRSGTMPDSQVFDIFGKLQEAYNATGNPNLKSGMDALMSDYQFGKQKAAQAKSSEKRPLDSSVTLTLSKFQDVGQQLSDIEKQYNKLSNPDPITGQIRLKNPYDKDVMQLQRMITAVVPTLARGVFGEVGVLTDEDVNRYTKLLANVETPKAQAAEAMSFLRNRVASGYQNYVDTFGKAGYDVGNFTALPGAGSSITGGGYTMPELGGGPSFGGGGYNYDSL